MLLLLIINIFITISKWFLFCLVLYFVYVYFLPFTRAHFVIGSWAVE
jgi:hypothetical protein